MRRRRRRGDGDRKTAKALTFADLVSFSLAELRRRGESSSSNRVIRERAPARNYYSRAMCVRVIIGPSPH